MAGFDLGRVIGAVLSGGSVQPRRGSPMGYGTRRAPSGNAQLGRALAGLASIAIAVLKRSQSSVPPRWPTRLLEAAAKGGHFQRLVCHAARVLLVLRLSAPGRL